MRMLCIYIIKKKRGGGSSHIECTHSHLDNAWHALTGAETDGVVTRDG